MKYFRKIPVNSTVMSVALGTVAAIGLGLATGYARADVKTAVGSDVSSKELRSITVESWDRDYSKGGYGWEVSTDKDTTSKDGVYQPVAATLQAEREVKLIKGTPQDVRENLNYAEARVLGVKFGFTFPGNNVVSIRPPHVDQYVVERPRPFLSEYAVTGDYKSRSCYKDPALSSIASGRALVIDCLYGIELPGEVHQVSVWVMGRGNEYDLEGWFEDWKGATHIIKFGSINFVGWRPLSITIPKSIPQDVNSYPAIKTLVFKQFKIRSRTDTSLETVYVFFDELRVLTDIFEVHFDGAQLDFDKGDCERKNHLLKLIRDNARNPQAYSQLVDCTKSPGPAAPFQNAPAGQPTNP
ncbi:MAG: endoflagellar filament sheath protein [Leptospirales bacterium]|nr:endoflagellar filament sheath protein [Leptospirales bacterium]